MSDTKALERVVNNGPFSMSMALMTLDEQDKIYKQAAAELEQLKTELEEVHKSKLPFKQMPCGHTTRYLVSTHEGIDRCVLCDSERLRAERDEMRKEIQNYMDGEYSTGRARMVFKYLLCKYPAQVKEEE
jgi:hypothetical protein